MAQVKPLVFIRVLTGKYRGAEGEEFVYLRQAVLRKRVDKSAKLSKVGWEANELASMMVTRAKLKPKVAGARVVVVVVVAVEMLKAVNLVEELAMVVAMMEVERLAVAAEDRKAIMGR